VRVRWLIGGLLPLLLVAACTGFPFGNRPASPRAEAGSASDAGTPRATLELHDVHYDGLVLSGRLLISPVEGSLRLDKRLQASIDVNIGRVSNCTGAPTTSMVMDFFPPAVRQEDLLILDPGYWYGGPVRFKLFSERFTGLGPECIEAELSLLSFDGQPVASIPIRAVRAALATADGGTTGEPPLTLDAGSP
jgi:hypothetical protein